MMRALDPVIYWLALFSIVFHGLSIPALNAFYEWKGVEPIIEDDAMEAIMRSEHEPLPSNAYVDKRGSVIVNNRFSRPNLQREINIAYPSKLNSNTDGRIILTKSRRELQGSRHVLTQAKGCRSVRGDQLLLVRTRGNE